MDKYSTLREWHMAEQLEAQRPRQEDSSQVSVIEPQLKDLGGFSVRRVLPAKQHRMVGPFIFFDHFGPAEFPPGEGIQVRPHPHIGIATISYLFEGQIVHRDSLGYTQVIRPGAVNLMTAGRGIVHSERAGDDLDEVSSLHGLQLWIALPDALEKTEPDFIHYPEADIPGFDYGHGRIRLIMGHWLGQASPVKQHSPTVYAECQLAAGENVTLPVEHAEIAVYGVSGALRANGEELITGLMLAFDGTSEIRLEALEDSRVVLVVGDPVGKRHIWWNFVASDRAMIEQAKADWKAGRSGRVPGDDEFIPLPD
jgi:redox-sensitive bicupin YhaK (pirin superfamily)